ELRQVVVQIRGDLRPLILPLLRHPIRKLLQDLLTSLQFNMRLLQRLASEEQLSSDDNWRQERRNRPKPDAGIQVGNDDTHKTESQIANTEFAELPDPQLPNDFIGREAICANCVHRH